MRSVLNWKITTLVFIVGTLLQACGDDGIIDIPSSEDQLTSDIAEIEDYLSTKGYTEVDTTDSEVRYVILNEGSGELIELNDIITLHYTARLLDDQLVISTIDSVIENHNNVQPDSTTLLTKDVPLVFTHTSSGWGMASATSVSGLADGGTAALLKINVGGSAKILVPSLFAGGELNSLRFSGSIPIVFDIYPVNVRKQ
ncbi:FKBP-type peptidyl-prolyl cis-trans isomerase [Marinoscillum pacificum]|uniref:FKBP-type peptidyl-prolyl cis-trans isomerase n=1 Tax=Marinoscillum pacificum TaxID=392723 RepID=UPI0021578B72|nr:hypothetical protein [Marinoscillum pacificum]